MSSSRKKHREYMFKYRRAHYEQYKATTLKFVKKRKEIINYYKNKPCDDCGGWFNPWQMQYDHKIKEEKLFNVGGALHIPLATLITEIKKCDVVCANCHAERAYNLLWKQRSLLQ